MTCSAAAVTMQVASSSKRAAAQPVALRPFSRALAARPLAPAAPSAAPARRRRRAAAAAAAAAAPAQQKIRIKLKSYWVDLLHDAVEKIEEAAAGTGATIAGPVPLPTRCACRLAALLLLPCCHACCLQGSAGVRRVQTQGGRRLRRPAAAAGEAPAACCHRLHARTLARAAATAQLHA